MFSYNNLWKLLIDRNMTKTQLRQQIGIGTATLAKLSANENVSMVVLDKICKELHCKIEDVVTHIE